MSVGCVCVCVCCVCVWGGCTAQLVAKYRCAFVRVVVGCVGCVDCGAKCGGLQPSFHQPNSSFQPTPLINRPPPQKAPDADPDARRAPPRLRLAALAPRGPPQRAAVPADAWAAADAGHAAAPRGRGAGGGHHARGKVRLFGACVFGARVYLAPVNPTATNRHQPTNNRQTTVIRQDGHHQAPQPRGGCPEGAR